MLSSHVRSVRGVLSILALMILAAILPAVAGEKAPFNTGDPAFQTRLRGPVHPSKEVELTAPIGAIVSQVAVEETQLVKADQLLIQMDDAIPRSDVAVKEIEVEYSAANYDEAELTAKIAKELFEKGAGGVGEARRAELAAVSKKMAVQVSKENLNASKVQLAQFQIKAPFDGEIGPIKAEKGARLNQGDTALKIVSRYELEARLDIPVALMNDLKVGQTYSFEAEEPLNRPITAKLKSLDQNINYATRTFHCVFTIQNKDLALPSGFEVKLLWPQP